MDNFDIFALTALALFYSVFVGMTLLLCHRGINPFVLGKGKKGFSRLLEGCLFIALFYWSLEVVASATGWRISPLPSFFHIQLLGSFYSRMLGCLLIILGLLIYVLSLFSFGKSWRIGIDEANPGGLVTKGVFAFTRNPVFVFVDLLFTGVWFIYSTPIFLLAAVITIFCLHYQILQEEKFLEVHYGQEYRGYKEKVRRYL